MIQSAGGADGIGANVEIQRYLNDKEILSPTPIQEKAFSEILNQDNNFFLGATQFGINTSFNLLRKTILLIAPLTNGISLLPYGPIAIIQAALAVHSTKIIGKLAAREIFQRSKISYLEPFFIIQKIIIKEPEIFNHINIYLSNRNTYKNYTLFLP